MTDIVITIAGKVSEYLVAPIGRQLSYLFCYRSYTHELQKKVQKLGEELLDVQITVKEAKRRGDQIRPTVQDWLHRVEEITGEAKELMEDENKSCFNGWCPNLKSRYLLSREADKKAQVIVQVQNDHNFPRGVSYHVPPRSVTFKNYEPFGSRASILKEIMNALTDAEMKMIGVWGMGGVGKTTLVKQVAEQAKQEKLFTTEVYIDVSWTREEKIQEGIAKIQQKIADMIGLKFEGNDESTKAAELKQRLRREKILIILDDIWNEVSLEEVGIPSKDDQTECKIVLSSRDRDILYKDMDAQICFRIQQLPLEEAWSLFNKTAGSSLDKNLKLQPIAIQVVEECEGLPIAIVTIAKALKGESMDVWENALEELRRSAPTNIRGVGKKVYSCLELSYNHLETNAVKSLFLLCGLLGDGDIPLDDLLKYGMGLDLFDYIDSLEQAKKKLLTLVKILKASSLLLEVEDGHYHYRGAPSLFFVEEDNEFVRMHDIVRDVAQAIASKDPHRFVVKEDVGLQEWQKRDGELRNCTAISLKCTRVHELPEGLVCPKLLFFMLNGDDNSLKFPDTFFKEMKEIRVLNLFRIDLTQLPSSLLFLSNLQTLCLHGCGLLTDIAILGELKKLQILSLVDCKIVSFPEEMMHLTDLRTLSLRNCPILSVVPRNVISSLYRLEHLCMINSFDEWEGDGANGRGRNAWLSELKHLSCLKALEVEIPHSYLLPEDVSFENLTRYDIFIGCRLGLYDDKKTSRRLTLNDVKGPHLAKCFSKLLKTIEVLELRSLDDTKHFVYDLEREGFLQLKYLSITRSDAMQYIMNTMKMKWVDRPHGAFRLLEELQLSSLSNLEAVCQGPIPMGCFNNLRDLIMEKCYSLKYILWLPTAQGRESVRVFPQLRSLILQHLPDLIEFYSTGTSGSQETFIPFFNRQVALPELKYLDLKSVDNVRKIWDNQLPIDSFCKLKELDLNNCKNLLTVFPSNSVEGLQSLQILKIENCCSLKEIFEVGEINGAKLAFWNLNLLKVGNCTSLKYLFPASVVKGLVQLEILKISNCKYLLIVFPSNFLEGFQSLQILEIEDCCSLKKIFEVGEINSVEFDGTTVTPLEEISLHGQNMKDLQGHRAFQNLNSLKVGNCTSLKYLFPTSVAKGLVQLEVLKIFDCGVKEIVANENGLEAVPFFLFPRLISLKLTKLYQLKRFYWDMYALECPLLKKLVVRNCDKVELLFQEKSLHGEFDKQPLFLVGKKTFPNVEELKLGLKGPMEIWRGQFSRVSFGKLRVLEIKEFHDLSVAIPSGKLQVPHNLEQLNLRSCNSVKDLIQVEGLAGETLPQLTKMYLEDLPMLTHLSGLGPTLQNLRSLQVSKCGNLTKLVSPSMAKTLVQLEELTVGHCDELKEIVENEGDEAMDDEIVFTKLQMLQLRCLSNLKSFSSARYTFRFPCLTAMQVIECPKMEFFCKGDSITPRLDGVEIDYCGLYWENDLNTSIQKQFMETHPKGEDSEEEVPDEEDAEEGNYEEQHPKVEDFVEKDTKEEDSDQEEVPDEEDAEEGNSEEQHPKVEDSVEKDAQEEDSEEEVPDEEDAEEVNSEEQHPKVEDSVEKEPRKRILKEEEAHP